MSRELDAEIAVKLFRENEAVVAALALGPFAYSSTWDGAGKVIEEMQRQGWRYRLESSGANGHAVYFWREMMPSWTAGERAEAPRAVCESALAALGGEARE